MSDATAGSGSQASKSLIRISDCSERIHAVLISHVDGANKAWGFTRQPLDMSAGRWQKAGINLVKCAMAMKSFLLTLFTWWNSQTFGTQFWTWRYGEIVGEDEFGNRYYRTRGGKIDPTLGFERRWVVYNGYAEASACRRPGMAGFITPSIRRRRRKTTSHIPGKSRTART